MIFHHYSPPLALYGRQGLSLRMENRRKKWMARSFFRSDQRFEKWMKEKMNVNLETFH